MYNNQLHMSFCHGYQATLPSASLSVWTARAAPTVSMAPLRPYHAVPGSTRLMAQPNVLSVNMGKFYV